jgi:hypothetical protein
VHDGHVPRRRILGLRHGLPKELDAIGSE